MSWLTGLAGKAEELLNKVDQTAGQSLNTSTIAEEGSLAAAPYSVSTTDQLSQAASHLSSSPSSSPRFAC